MISTLVAACVIMLAFRQLVLISMNPRLEWDVSPLLLLFFTAIVTGQTWSMIHRRLS